MVNSVVSVAGLAGALALTVGCAVGVSAGVDELALEDARDNVVSQGLFDCSESQDTGYTQGNAFSITVVTVDDKPLEVDTANAYVVMQEAAANDGVDLRVVSGFRTMDQQTYLYGCYTNCNCNSCNLAAQPGYSNHQSGHALDLNTSDGGVLDWLNAHGGDYGFARTVPSEVWHWEWWGGGPGGGPCGADAACVADHNYGACNGTVITSCDANNHLGSGDCAAYGATCSENNGAHCVDFRCAIDDGNYCASSSVQGTCSHGAYSESACADGVTCGGASGTCGGSAAVGEGEAGGEGEGEGAVDVGEGEAVGEGEGEGEAGSEGGGHGTVKTRALPPSVTGGCASSSSSGAPATVAVFGWLAFAVAYRARRRREQISLVTWVGSIRGDRC